MEDGPPVAVETPGEPEAPARPPRRSGLYGWTAYGAGVGIEVREKDLQVTIVRVRPSEAGVLGAATVTDYRNRPAAEWGTELLGFLRKTGAGHIAATVLLPRRDVIVRSVYMPGVTDKDLESAVRLQVESLHPFADEEVSYSHARIGKSAFVLVGITRREVLDGYSSLFAEAGLKVVSFTFSAAAVYSALRLITDPPVNFLVAHEVEGAFELYGESEARALYSTSLPVARTRAIGVARAELRLDPDVEARRLADLLPRPALFPSDYDPDSARFEANILTYATALAGACPWLGIEGNLLPQEMRRGSSRLRLIPTIVLATLLTALLVVLGFESRWADGRYLNVLQYEIAKFQPFVKRSETLDAGIARSRARSQSLDDFRRRSKLDMDTLAEVTKLIPAPGWVSTFDMDRQMIQVGGEMDQAATLLRTLDNSPLLEKSEFTMPITRSGTGELFRLRAARQVPPVAVAAGASPVRAAGPAPAVAAPAIPFPAPAPAKAAGAK